MGHVLKMEAEDRSETFMSGTYTNNCASETKFKEVMMLNIAVCFTCQAALPYASITYPVANVITFS
jgi:hypothetical protein